MKKILLCSPITGVVGGIAKWTNHIKSYYESLEEKSIELEFLDFSRKRSGQTIESKLKKIYFAISDYFKLIIYTCKKIREFAQKVSNDILEGGLVEFKEDVDEAIAAGATAVSTANRELWNYR